MKAYNVTFSGIYSFSGIYLSGHAIVVARSVPDAKLLVLKRILLEATKHPVLGSIRYDSLSIQEIDTHIRGVQDFENGDY